MSRLTRPAFVTLLLLAAANVAAAVMLSAWRPFRAIDLVTVWNWCRGWLDGRDLYRLADSVTNYPPYGIVWLAPIAFLPVSELLPSWIVLNVVLALATAILVARTIANPPPARTATAVLLFLCWACVRNLLQFSMLSMALAFLAILWVEAPVVSGAALALALVKPHIAVPVALALAGARRLRPVVTAALLTMAGTALYAWHVHTTMETATYEYFRVLERMYTGPGALYGRTSLQSWIVSAAGARWGDPISIAIAMGLLVFTGALALATRPHADPARTAIVRAMFCVWALLSVFQLAHNFVLFLPAFMTLVLIDHAPTRRPRYAVAGVMTAALTVDLPVRLAPALQPGWLLTIVNNLDRLLACVTFVYLAVLWTRLSAGDTAVAQAAVPRQP